MIEVAQLDAAHSATGTCRMSITVPTIMVSPPTPAGRQGSANFTPDGGGGTRRMEPALRKQTGTRRPEGGARDDDNKFSHTAFLRRDEPTSAPNIVTYRLSDVRGISVVYMTIYDTNGQYCPILQRVSVQSHLFCRVFGPEMFAGTGERIAFHGRFP